MGLDQTVHIFSKIAPAPPLLCLYFVPHRVLAEGQRDGARAKTTLSIRPAPKPAKLSSNMAGSIPEGSFPNGLVQKYSKIIDSKLPSCSELLSSFCAYQTSWIIQPRKGWRSDHFICHSGPVGHLSQSWWVAPLPAAPAAQHPPSASWLLGTATVTDPR